jgi:hypothetical protein
MSNANDILAAARDGVRHVLEVDPAVSERDLVMELHDNNHTTMLATDKTFVLAALVAAAILLTVFVILVKAFVRRRGDALPPIPLDFSHQRRLVKQAMQAH